MGVCPILLIQPDAPDPPPEPGVLTPTVKLLSSAATRMAPYVAHVRLGGTYDTDSELESESTGGVGNYSTLNILWDFGDPLQQMVPDYRPSKVDIFDLSTAQRGFNSAFLYMSPGLKTVQVTVYNQAGDTGTGQVQFTIAANTRSQRYVDAVNGNDAWTGANQSETVPGVSGDGPWRTWNKAVASKSANMQINFKRGDTFLSASSTLSVNVSNLYIEAYGSGAPPIIVAPGNVLVNMSGGENFIMRNVKLNTTALGVASAIGRASTPYKNNAFINVISNTLTTGGRWDHFFDLWQVDAHAEGILLQGCSTDEVTSGGTQQRSITGTRQRSVVINGCRFGASVAQQILRPSMGVDAYRTDCMKMEFCRINGQYLTYNSYVRFQAIHHLHVSRNSFLYCNAIELAYQNSDSRYFRFEQNYLDCQTSTGTSGPLQPGNRLRDSVIQSNIIHGTTLTNLYNPGLIWHSSHTDDFGPPGSTNPDAYDDVERCLMVHNTWIKEDDGANTKMLLSFFHGIAYYTFIDSKISNNLFIYPNSAGVIGQFSKLSEFSEIKNNVWPTAGGSTFLKDALLSPGGGGDPARTYAQFIAEPNVVNQVRENLPVTACVAPSFYPPAGSAADSHSAPGDAPGCMFDYNDNVRDLAAPSWSSGAAEGAFRP